MAASSLPTPGVAHVHAGARSPRLAKWIFGIGMAINLLVCLPFLFDPMGWLSLGAAQDGAGDAVDYVVLLADPDPAARRGFLQAHPELEVVHEGGTLNTLQIRVRGPAASAVSALKAQSFALLVARGGAVLCR